ncbi:MAG: type VII toxin-antitoxin system HepT family RNase toxin [Solirubrobacteraceae bacterium]
MVDPESITNRLARLAQLLAALQRTHAEGLDAYLADADARAATERRLQLAIQVCIDIGAHLVSELDAEPASDYAGVFGSLAAAGVIDAELATRLARATGQRNVLVHDYLVVDDRLVFEALAGLDDLRGFAADVQRLLDAGG